VFNSSKIKIDPNLVYVAAFSFATQTDTIAGGTRLRGDHPIVQRNAAHWVPDGIDDLTRNQLLAERFPDYMPDFRR
jgi:hypothetical protein